MAAGETLWYKSWMLRVCWDKEGLEVLLSLKTELKGATGGGALGKYRIWVQIPRRGLAPMGRPWVNEG